jgi:Ser/Thr protein kinase RdoA (MazF antagonist)
MTSPRDSAAAFALDGGIVDLRRHGSGLINDTWLVTTDNSATPRVILQRLNRAAFPRPGEISDNIEQLLAHVRARQAAEGARAWDLRFPRLYRTREGAAFLIDAQGDAWRAMSYFEHTLGFHKPRDTAQAREAGRALGRFHALVEDMDIARLHDTRPDFHNTPRHLERLAQALEQGDPALIAQAGVRECLDFVDAHRAGAGEIEAALVAGRIRRQAVHGDPKLDNFLFDEESGHAVALIDLDTFKPGILHHDIADCLRSCCNRSGESPASGVPVHFDLETCEATLGEYFREAGAAVAGMEAGHLVAAIRLIPFELGARFLADHLNGNRYFRTEYPEQNLRRAQTQFRLVDDIEHKRDAIAAQIAPYL